MIIGFFDIISNEKKSNVFKRRALSCFLISIAFLASACTSLDEEEIKTITTKITSIHPTDKRIGIKEDDKYLKILIKEDTRIAERGNNIGFLDLDVGDKVNISYVNLKGDGLLWGFSKSYVANTINVLE